MSARLSKKNTDQDEVSVLTTEQYNEQEDGSPRRQSSRRKIAVADLDDDYVYPTTIKIRSTRNNEIGNIEERKKRKAAVPRKCLYPDCTNIAQPGGDYCGHDCAVADADNVLMRLAERRALKSQEKEKQKEVQTPRKKSRLSSQDDTDYVEQSSVRGSRSRTNSIASSSNLADDSRPIPTSTQSSDPLRKNVVKVLNETLAKILEDAIKKDPQLFVSERTETKIDDEKNLLPSDTDFVSKKAADFASAIEEELYSQLSEENIKGGKGVGEKYKAKFRSLTFNLKDKNNDILRMRVISGELTPSELISLSVEDLANPELKSKAEALRRKSLKDIVIKDSQQALFIKKTHKGEIVMSSDEDLYPLRTDVWVTPTSSSSQSKPDEPTTPITPVTPITPITPSKENMDVFDNVLARMGGSRTSVTPKRISIDSNTDAMTRERRVSESYETDIKLDENDYNPSKEQSIQKDHTSSKMRLGAPMSITSENTATASLSDVIMYSPSEMVITPKSPGPNEIIWTGNIDMPQVAKFQAIAYQIGGPIEGNRTWESVLNSLMFIEGRVAPAAVDDYLSATQFSSTKEIVLIDVQAIQDDPVQKEQFDILFNYFHCKSRYGVVRHPTSVKDMYLVPAAANEPLPDCCVTVTHDLPESKREKNMLLGFVVINRSTMDRSGRSDVRRKRKTPSPRLQTHQRENSHVQPVDVSPHSPASKPYDITPTYSSIIPTIAPTGSPIPSKAPVSSTPQLSVDPALTWISKFSPDVLSSMLANIASGQTLPSNLNAELIQQLVHQPLTSLNEPVTAPHVSLDQATPPLQTQIPQYPPPAISAYASPTVHTGFYQNYSPIDRYDPAFPTTDYPPNRPESGQDEWYTKWKTDGTEAGPSGPPDHFKDHSRAMAGEYHPYRRGRERETRWDRERFDRREQRPPVPREFERERERDRESYHPRGKGGWDNSRGGRGDFRGDYRGRRGGSGRGRGGRHQGN